VILNLLSRLVGAAVLALVCPLATHAAATEVPIAGNFVGGSYTVSSSGTVFVYVAPREVSGKLAVCGFVFFEKATATTRSLEKQFTSQMYFSIGGTRLTVNTGKFKRYKTEDEANAGTAGCSVTNVAWQAGFGKAEIEINMRNNTVFQ
jgi:hypothetical protein